jgi:hypothetical protein
MNFRTAISILVALMLALTSVSSFAGQGKGGDASADRAQQVDRDRTYDRDRIQDRDRIDVPDQDRDRTRDRDKIHDPDQDQVRDRDRIHTQDPLSLEDKYIYGNELMTEGELNQYRKQLKKASTVQAREQFQAQHEEKMQQRAMQQGQDLVPPGQGPIYGGKFMSVQERNQYREQLRLLDSDAERQQFQAQHREQMNTRARELDLEIEEAE